MSKTVLIAGASGLVGFAAMRAFARGKDTRVVAVSRRKPLELQGAEWLKADLTDAADCERVFSAMPDVTHLVFAALYEEPDLVAGWDDPRQIDVNGRMLRNLFDPLRAAARGLKQVILLQGTKAYRRRGRQVIVPARPGRDEDRTVPNFYWVQEDYLRALQATSDWSLTILRPQVIFGLSIGAAMNPIPALGVYATLLKEAGERLHFPGGENDWVFEAVHADLLANAMVWATNTPRARNNVYNITNGDVIVWRNVWPTVADEFGMEPGEDRPTFLDREMWAREGDWLRIVRKYGLRAPAMRQFVHQGFQYLDLLMGPQRSEKSTMPLLVSTVSLRQDGFHEVWDSEDMLRDCIRQFRRLELLPSR